MTVADRLGKGTSFGTVGKHRLSDRGRAKAIAEGAIPEYELVRIQLTDITPTPLNPRRNFGTDEEKTELGESLRQAQLQPCTCVTRDLYLNLWPDQESRIGAAEYVLLNGERRYRSALHVGLEALDFVVRDDLAASREDFVDNLLKENLDREDFDVIERARGVAEMVTVYAGNQAAAAGRLRKDRSWVTNQLILLTLPEEIQVMLSAGMPERDGRRMARHYKDNGRLSAAELVAWLESEKEQERQNRQAEKDLIRRVREKQVLSADDTTDDTTAIDVPAAAVTGTTQSDVLSADNTERMREEAPQAQTRTQAATDTPEVAEAEQVLSADNTAKPDTPEAAAAEAAHPSLSASEPTLTSASIPHQTSPAVAALPWSDLDAVADLLFANLQPDELDELAQLIADRLTSRTT